MLRPYTVEPGKRLADHRWTPEVGGAYDLWVLGPAGFHRHFTSNARRAASAGHLSIRLVNTGPVPCTFTLSPNAYLASDAMSVTAVARGETVVTKPLSSTGGWYDFGIRFAGQPDFSRRVAGRMETCASSISDPLMGGTAIGDQYRVA